MKALSHIACVNVQGDTSAKLPTDRPTFTLFYISINDLVGVHRNLGNGLLHALKVTR